MSAQDILRYLRPSAVPNEDYFAFGDSFTWVGPAVSPTAQEMADAALPAAKHWRTVANRAECTSRIFERYPAGRQLSASFGLYDSANVATMVDWIAANVAAENTAADLIEAATTVQEVEAVTVAWPV